MRLRPPVGEAPGLRERRCAGDPRARSQAGSRLATDVTSAQEARQEALTHERNAGGAIGALVALLALLALLWLGIWKLVELIAGAL